MSKDKKDLNNRIASAERKIEVYQAKIDELKEVIVRLKKRLND